jgi:hypothetical protein
MGMIIQKPIDSQMLQRATIALYNRMHKTENNVPWEEVAPWIQEVWEQLACIALEAAIPQEEDYPTPHTNFADAGLPHDSLTEYISQLECERNALKSQLIAALEERLILIGELRAARSAAST